MSAPLPQADISVFVAASNFQVAPVIAIIGGVAYMLEQISAPLFYELKSPIQRTTP
jgi:hypothetical protein